MSTPSVADVSSNNSNNIESSTSTLPAQGTSLYAHPYDCCRVAANAPTVRRTASCRAAQRWRIGARADPDVPLF